MLFWVKGRVVAETFGYVKHSIGDVENMVINLKNQELGLVESGYVTKWGEAHQSPEGGISLWG